MISHTYLHYKYLRSNIESTGRNSDRAADMDLDYFRKICSRDMRI